VTPIISPLLRSEKRALSLRWTIYDPDTLDAPMLAINSATDWASFTAAFSTFGGPGQNVVYADDQGNIGYHAVGYIPIRGNPSQPSPLSPVPVAATDTSHEWTGNIPFDQLPQAFDPPSGKLVERDVALPISLPLTNEVGEALIDYLKSGRPQSVRREVFLKVNPPFDPFDANNHLHHVVTYWRQLSRITFRSSQKRGIHSLRHTLATRLLEKGTPFTTIAGILGHTSLESTRIYAKADVEALRGVALDPEEVNHVG
jgi:hypothetical protein